MTKNADSIVPATDTAQTTPDSKLSCITTGEQGSTSSVTPVENTPEVDGQTETGVVPLPFEQVPFTGDISDEQFEEMVQAMKADGIHPMSPLDAFQEVSFDGGDACP